MGLRYAYEVLIPRASVDTLIESVGRHVADGEEYRRFSTSRVNPEDENGGQ
jgi:hypothetical protein